MNPDEVPQPLRIAAVAQVASGALGILLTWWVGACTVGTVCGLLSLGMGGQFCAVAPWLLMPLGVIEIGVGVFGMTSPREAARFQRLVAILQIASALIGGLPNAVCGVAVLLLLGQEGCRDWLAR